MYPTPTENNILKELTNSFPTIYKSQTRKPRAFVCNLRVIHSFETEVLICR